jgi:hypothetical protein
MENLSNGNRLMLDHNLYVNMAAFRCTASTGLLGVWLCLVEIRTISNNSIDSLPDESSLLPVGEVLCVNTSELSTKVKPISVR